MRHCGSAIHDKVMELYPDMQVLCFGVDECKVRDLDLCLGIEGPAPDFILLNIGGNDVLERRPADLIADMMSAVDRLHQDTGAQVTLIPLHPRVQGFPRFGHYNRLARLINKSLADLCAGKQRDYFHFPNFRTSVKPSYQGVPPARHHFDIDGIHLVGVYRQWYIKHCMFSIHSAIRKNVCLKAV